MNELISANRRTLNTKEIAEALGYHEQTVLKKFRAGQLPGAFQLGKGSTIKMSLDALEKIKRGAA